MPDQDHSHFWSCLTEITTRETRLLCAQNNKSPQTFTAGGFSSWHHIINQKCQSSRSLVRQLLERFSCIAARKSRPSKCQKPLGERVLVVKEGNCAFDVIWWATSDCGGKKYSPSYSTGQTHAQVILSFYLTGSNSLGKTISHSMRPDLRARKRPTFPSVFLLWKSRRLTF